MKMKHCYSSIQAEVYCLPDDENSLKLFMKSLPRGSRFAIISFGSNFDYMKINGEELIEYNNETSAKAIAEIEFFSANYGGTSIHAPFVAAKSLDVPGRSSDMQENGCVSHKRIFLLTDG